MKHKNPPIPVLIVLLLALAAGIFFGIRELVKSPSVDLTLSGTIEAVNISIAPEISGKVAEVRISEGQTVKAGDFLFRLDDALLQAQREIAAAALETAMDAVTTAEAAAASASANYELALAAARAEAAPLRTAGWQATTLEAYTVPGGTFTQPELIAAAQTEVNSAALIRDQAADALENLLADPANASFVEAEKALLTARFTLLAAQDALGRAELSDNAQLQEAAQSAYDDDLAILEEAQATYDDLLASDSAVSLLDARAQLTLAQEHLDSAQDRLQSLQTGEYSLRVTAASAALAQANAAVEQTSQAVLQAQANLNLVDVQLSKLIITAPDQGVVVTATIQPGEIITAGTPVVTLADLSNLELTVYIPEDLYGQISLGQNATLSVDSFPQEMFTATVIHMADQAEFTPRNVQTIEGRKTTVFAIRLTIDNPLGKLKPGMPADVVFQP
jgi:HlyD family secretion protein